MPVYEIEQYELHTQKFRVEAIDEAEAIVKLLDGDADAMDNSLEYIEVAEDMGLRVEDCRELAEKLEKLGVPVSDQVIPSIRSVEQID